MESLGKRLAEVENYIAESRDDNDEIRLSEITERIQQLAHMQEIMSVKMHGIENQIKSTRRLTITIGAAVAVLLAEVLRYAN